MSTQIQVLPKSGLTIGTTPITSGVAGRVLFEGAGNVVQEDANFTFDSTLKRLTLKAVGTTASDIPFVVRNSADTADLLKVAGNKITLNGPSGTAFTPSIDLQRNGTSIFFIDEYAAKFNAPAYFSSIVGYGSNPIYISPQSGSLGNITLYPVSSGISLGYSSTAARLDVKAQGALSTDIAFRVRNSADTSNLQQFNGDGSWLHRNNAGTFYEYYNGTNQLEYRYTGIFNISTNNDVTRLQVACNQGDLLLRGGSNILHIVNNNNYHFEETSGILTTSGAGAIVLKNRTAPSTNVQDRFYLYSADIVAGNAAPHFRTEDGSVIKLYKQNLATNPTNAELATFLSNLGLANLI